MCVHVTSWLELHLLPRTAQFVYSSMETHTHTRLIALNFRGSEVQLGDVIIEKLAIRSGRQGGFFAKMTSLLERSEWAGLSWLGAPGWMFTAHQGFRPWAADTGVRMPRPLQEDQCSPSVSPAPECSDVKY